MLRLLVVVEPGDVVEHEDAAAIPVALLVIRSNPSHAAAEALGVERRIVRVVLGDDGELPFGGGGAAGRADLAVGPGTRRQPLHFIDAIGQRPAQHVRQAFGPERPR